jgi:hypothetical protein
VAARAAEVTEVADMVAAERATAVTVWAKAEVAVLLEVVRVAAGRARTEAAAVDGRLSTRLQTGTGDGDSTATHLRQCTLQ